MTNEKFIEQMTILTSVYGPKAYPQERMKLILNAIKNMPDHWMESAVTHFVANNRQSPMLKDFIDEMEDYKKRRNEYARSGGSGSIIEILKEIPLTDSNKEFAQFCVKAISDKCSGKITKEQFWNEVMPLIEKTADLLCPQEKTG